MNTTADIVRKEVAETAETLVVKVGTNVLSHSDDTLNIERLQSLAEQIHHVHQSGRKVVLVSSGAIGAGMGLLGLTERPRDLRHLQAAASAGQAHLIRLYDDCLKPFGYHAAQVLLTTEDFKHRGRYLNVRNTLHTLFEYGAVPIVNENDTVSIDEIRFGDNDVLAAMVTNLLQAPLLCILSSIDGLYDGDPNEPGSKLIPLVKEWDESLLSLAQPLKSPRGTGGMQTKLEAVRLATSVGESVLLANGHQDNILQDIIAGKNVGTLFLAQGANIPAWKRWIGFTVTPRGTIAVDAGAQQAVMQSGKSLLAIGMTDIQGEFEQGEIVSIADSTGKEFARGLSNYNSQEARTIKGLRKEEILKIWDQIPHAEVIHRDNLVVTN